MGTIKALLRYRNPDLTVDINTRNKAFIPKGVFSGGDVLPIVAQLQINVNAFYAIGADGMIVEHTGTTQLAVTAGITQWVILRAIYRSNGPPTAQLEVLSNAAYLADPDIAKLVVIARIILGGGATEVTNGDISYEAADRLDKIDRFFIRGTVANVAGLTTILTAPTRVRAGDVYLAVAERTLWRWTGGVWEQIAGSNAVPGVAPVAVLVGVAPASGVDTGYARGDHQHGIAVVTTATNGAWSAAQFNAHIQKSIDGILSGFTVSGTSLTLPVALGTLISNGAFVTIPAITNVVLPDGQTNYVYYNGTIVTSTTTYATAANTAGNVLIARAVTSGGVITVLEDLRKFVNKDENKVQLVVNTDPTYGHFTTIQAAINFVKAARNNSIFKPYYEILVTDPQSITVPISFADCYNVALRGVGNNTSTFVSSTITWSFVGNAIVTGGASGITIENLFFDYAGIAGNSAAIVVSSGSSEITIQNNSSNLSVPILNTFVRLDGSNSDVTIEKNLIEVYNIGIEVNGVCSRVNIVGNVCRMVGVGSSGDTYGFYGVFVTGNATDFNVSDNVIHPPGSATKGFQYGIRFVGANNDNITIANNSIYFSGTTVAGAPASVAGIIATGMQNSEITGNYYSSALSTGSTNLGLSLAVYRSVISQNIVVMTGVALTLSSALTVSLSGFGTGTTGVSIDNNTLLYSGSTGNIVNVTGILNVTITGNMILGNSAGSYNGINCTANTANVSAVGNTVANVATSGSSSTGFAIRNITVVSNNNIIDCYQGIGAPTGPTTNRTISGNALHNITSLGIVLDNTRTSVVGNNVTSAQDCISIGSTATFALIASNHLHNTDSGYSPITVNGDDCTITGNTIGRGTGVANGIAVLNARCNIQSNVILINGSAANAVRFFNGATNGSFTNNKINGVTGRVAFIEINNSNMNVSGNVFIGTFTTSMVEIDVTGTSDNVVENNMFVGDQSGTPLNSVRGVRAGLERTIIRNNTFKITSSSADTATCLIYAYGVDNQITGNKIYWDKTAYAGTVPTIGIDLPAGSSGQQIVGNWIDIQAGAAQDSQGVVISATSPQGVCTDNYIRVVFNDNGVTVLYSDTAVHCQSIDWVISNNYMTQTNAAVRGNGVRVQLGGGTAAIIGNRLFKFAIGIHLLAGAPAGTVVGNVATGCTAAVQNVAGWAAVANNI